MLTNLSLQRIKTVALRRRVWYKTLSKIERSVMDLTIRCVKRVQSNALANALLIIVDKLLATFQEPFTTQARRIGRTIATKLAEIALKWGNQHALNWENDPDFATFLGTNALNT